MKYQIFGAGHTGKMAADFLGIRRIRNYIDNIKSMSIIDTGVDVKFGDKLVTLSTCAYHVEDGRFAVIAKKIDNMMD